MKAVRLVLVTALALSPELLSAQSGPDSYVQPSIALLGTSERGSGAAFAPPRDGLRRDDAASLAIGLDARKVLPRGRIEGSGFGLAHDPLSADDRGFYFAGRLRGSFDWNDHRWTLRIEESPRLQRRDTASLSDFQRNEVWLELERATSVSGPKVSLRISDRRRSVRGDAGQGFDRQTVLGALTGGDPSRRVWRLEAGPQRYSTDAARGWRFTGGLEMIGTFAKARMAVRLGWIEPLSDRVGNADGISAPTVLPLPSPSPLPPTPSGPSRDVVPREGLLGPSLVVDPLESDEGDWDFGRRKQEIVALGTRRFGAHLWLTVEMSAQRERGPDLTAPTTVGTFVHRDRLALRAHLRRELGPRLALIAQGGWQRLHDNRPDLSYSRSLVCLGLEVRP